MCTRQFSKAYSIHTGTLSISLLHWLWHTGLLLNPDESVVAALFGTRQRLARPGWPTHVAVAGSDIKMSDHLKVLDVTLDLSMTLDIQLKSQRQSGCQDQSGWSVV